MLKNHNERACGPFFKIHPMKRQPSLTPAMLDPIAAASTARVAQVHFQSSPPVDFQPLWVCPSPALSH